jgi:hypothetical protein
MRWMLALLWLSSPGILKATVTVGSSDCPQQFEARVITVLEEEQSDSFFTLERIKMENLRTLKGKVNDKVSIEIVRGGPFDLTPGKNYLVHMRSGRLCWVEEI